MTRRAVVPFNPRQYSGMSAAIFVAFLTVSVNAARADCVLDNNMTLARVVTKEAKLYFISGPRKQAPACPSDANACRLKVYLVPGDEVLTNATDDPYVCAKFKSQSFIETISYLPRASLELVLPDHPSIEKWNGTWRRDPEAEIALKSTGDDVTVIGSATWGSGDPQRVKRGAVHTGELEGAFRPRGRVLAIGYDPDRSGFPPAKDEASEVCAAKLELVGRYLVVEDNGRCGGVNVSFNGLYVRADSK